MSYYSLYYLSIHEILDLYIGKRIKIKVNKHEGNKYYLNDIAINLNEENKGSYFALCKKELNFLIVKDIVMKEDDKYISCFSGELEECEFLMFKDKENNEIAFEKKDHSYIIESDFNDLIDKFLEEDNDPEDMIMEVEKWIKKRKIKLVKSKKYVQTLQTIWCYEYDVIRTIENIEEILDIEKIKKEIIKNYFNDVSDELDNLNYMIKKVNRCFGNGDPKGLDIDYLNYQIQMQINESI